MLDRSRLLCHIRATYLTFPSPGAADTRPHLGRLHRLRRFKSEMVVDPICSLPFHSFPTRTDADATHSPPAGAVYRYDEDNPALSLAFSLFLAFLAFARKRQNRVLNARGTQRERKRGSIIFRFFPVCNRVSRTSSGSGNISGNAKGF